MSPEIQRADERLRIRLLILLTIVAVLGAAGLLGLENYFAEFHNLTVEAQPAAAVKAERVVRAILVVMATGGVLFSLYLGRISWRTVRSERYPPPGARVLSDTEIRHGRQARRRGQAGLALALLTLLLTVAVVVRANSILGSMLDTTLKPTRVDYGGPTALPLP